MFVMHMAIMSLNIIRYLFRLANILKLGDLHLQMWSGYCNKTLEGNLIHEKSTLNFHNTFLSDLVRSTFLLPPVLKGDLGPKLLKRTWCYHQ